MSMNSGRLLHYITYKDCMVYVSIGHTVPNGDIKVTRRLETQNRCKYMEDGDLPCRRLQLPPSSSHPKALHSLHRCVSCGEQVPCRLLSSTRSLIVSSGSPLTSSCLSALLSTTSFLLQHSLSLPCCHSHSHLHPHWTAPAMTCPLIRRQTL